jgi:hypothetical protein
MSQSRHRDLQLIHKDFHVKPPGILLAAALALAAGSDAAAKTSPGDLQVAARALSFMERPLTGDVRLGILFAPDSPASTKAAEDLQRMIGSGLHAGALVFHPVLLRTDQPIAGRADVLFLEGGVGPAAARMADVARAQRILCLTTDIDQVRTGACAIGVRASPKVEVFVSRQAATRSAISFSTIFRILITEL